MAALNLFHLRNGQIVDRREFFWEDQDDFDEPRFFSSPPQAALPRPAVHSRPKSTSRWSSRTVSRSRSCSPKSAGRRVEIRTPQRGQKKALMDLVQTNARHSFDARFPRPEAILQGDSGGAPGGAEPARAAFTHRMFRHFPHPGHGQSRQHGGMGRRQDEEGGLPEVHHPHRGRQRRFRQHAGGGDAALLPPPGGEPPPARAGADRWRGWGQLHAAAGALEAIGVSDQPLASIAKREEIIYVYGQEDEPIALDRFSPILHLIQSIRDEAHRFAVTFHRNRRFRAPAHFRTGRHPWRGGGHGP